MAIPSHDRFVPFLGDQAVLHFLEPALPDKLDTDKQLIPRRRPSIHGLLAETFDKEVLAQCPSECSLTISESGKICGETTARKRVS